MAFAIGLLVRDCVRPALMIFPVIRLAKDMCKEKIEGSSFLFGSACFQGFSSDGPTRVPENTGKLRGRDISSRNARLMPEAPPSNTAATSGWRPTGLRQITRSMYSCTVSCGAGLGSYGRAIIG